MRTGGGERAVGFRGIGSTNEGGMRRAHLTMGGVRVIRFERCGLEGTSPAVRHRDPSARDRVWAWREASNA